MPEIRLVKKYTHIKDEDVTSIFQEGYVKCFENGRKDAIPIEWINEWVERDENYWDYQYLTDVLLKDWEKENATEITD